MGREKTVNIWIEVSKITEWDISSARSSYQQMLSFSPISSGVATLGKISLECFEVLDTSFITKISVTLLTFD